MNKEKVLRLIKYADDLKNRLSSPVPPKHTGHESEFKQFLERELSSVTSKIESLKMDAASK